MKAVLRKIGVIFLIFTFINSMVVPCAYSYTEVPNFLFERGIEYYRDGYYKLALDEFKYALLLNPEHKLAREYIHKIEGGYGLDYEYTLPTSESPSEEISLITEPQKKEPEHKYKAKPKSSRIKDYLDRAEEKVEKPSLLKRPISTRRRIKKSVDKPLPKGSRISDYLDRAEKKVVKKPSDQKYRDKISTVEEPASTPSIKHQTPARESLEVVFLNKEELSNIPMPIEIEIGKTIIIAGSNISRFLVITPNVMDVKKKSSDEIEATGKDIGFTYLHIWDKNERWTLYFQGILPRAAGPTFEEEVRMAETRASNLMLRYGVNWFNYERGRRLNDLNRQSYSYRHSFNLSGDTPYGHLNADANYSVLKNTRDLTYLALGLTNGKLGQFKDFTVKAVDFSPGFSNLAYGSTGLRGVMLSSPAFDKKMNYTVFWGREGGGRYGALSPGLAEPKDSFVRGINVDYKASETVDYGFSYINGWGDERQEYLQSDAYDMRVKYHTDHFGLKHEVGYDTTSFSNLTSLNYNRRKLNFTTEFRNVDKDYNTISGSGSRLGERGFLSTLNFSPLSKLLVSNRLNFYEDNLFPNPDKPDRWNADYDLNMHYSMPSGITANFNYNNQNQLGSISPRKYESKGVTLGKSIKLFMRDVSLSAGYRNAVSENITSPNVDYENDKLSLGLRVNIIGSLYYYINKEMNWLEATYTDTRSRPHSLDMGLSWYSQVSDSPFYTNARLTYRDEENSDSTLSFSSGEDYLEGSGELTYKPKPGTEMFLSTRLRNVWADNPDVTKRMEWDLRAGIRYLFDTGFSWTSVGAVDGFVVNDLNGDGIIEEEEPGIEGIKVYLGNDRSEITDADGYYRFDKVKAKRASVSIDVSNLPEGFILTTPILQDVEIIHNGISDVHFGAMSRSEIIGAVFEDVNGDNKFGLIDVGIEHVTLTLDDGRSTITDSSGKFYFRNAGAGEHTIILDINSIPIELLPKIPIVKKITLFEGMSFKHNIPLKR
ncbi:MAG: SdrD B-like domain-containing protein [Candidatus Omnitrophota bacterium]